LYSFASLDLAGLDTSEQDPPPFDNPSTPPQVSLRRRLPKQHPCVVELLFAPLASFATPSSKGHVDERIARVLALMKSGEIRVPSEWPQVEPFSLASAGEGQIIGNQVITALRLRVNILEAYCKSLRTKQQDHADYYALDPERERSADCFDGCSHYAHLWLDAHLLFACAIDSAGLFPRDGSPELQALLEAYEPGAGMVFHEGEMPNLLDNVEQCSFFGDNPRDKDPLTYLFSKAVPHRCVVRDVIKIIESSCSKDDAVFHFFQAVIAASMLGVYRHSRKRPHLAERLRLYEYFFFVPNERVEKALDRMRRNRGVTMTRAEAFWCKFSGGAKRCPPGGVEACRRESLRQWLAAVQDPTAGGAGVKKRYLHQNTVVNVIREFLVASIAWLPHLEEELAKRKEWLVWQNTVVTCMDFVRAQAPGRHILKDVCSATMPSKNVTQSEKTPFHKAVHAAYTAFLDNSAAEARAGAPSGSDLPLDAPFTPQLDVVLRMMLREYPTAPGAPQVEVDFGTPGKFCTDERLQREWIDRGRFPLQLLYATQPVIREWRAAAATYRDTGSSSIAHSLVRYLSKTSMYQLQLIGAFSSAMSDRETIYAHPLPRHLAEQQANSLRKRLNAELDAPCPRHMLTTFVCRVCRKFRGTVLKEKHATGAQAPFGSELVSFASSSVEEETKRMLRGRAFPSWGELREEGRRHGTLFAWYKENAGVDMDMLPYPPDPSVFSANPEDLPKARAWKARVDEQEKDLKFWGSDASDDEGGGGERREWSPPRITGQLPDGAPMPRLTEDIAAGLTKGDLAEAWQERMGKRFICGHASQDPKDTCVIWTCASKSYKNEERSTRKTQFSQQKVQDAITDRQRESARRTADAKRRHDMRHYFRFSMCSRTRLIECNMLGWVVRVDKKSYVACCRCLAYTSTENAHWHGDSLLCVGCWRKTRAGGVSGVSVISSGTALKCLQCKRLPGAGETFTSTTVLDDKAMRFLDVFFCEQHKKKKAWILTSPNYHSLSTVEAGLKAGWGNLRHWETRRDYLRAVQEREADEDRMDRHLVKQVRASLGKGVIDGEGDDGDSEDGEEGKKRRQLMPPPKTAKRLVNKTGTAKGAAGSQL